MMKKKHLFSVFLILFFSNACFSQLDIKLSTVKFTEDIGYVYKPGIGLELEYTISEYFDGKGKLTGGVGVILAKPKMSSFPSYAIGANTFIGGTPQTQVVPTSASYSHILVIPISLQYNYRVLDYAISPYVEVGLSLNPTTYEIEKEGGFIGGNEIVEIVAVGWNSEVGITYQINKKLQIRLGLSKNSSLKTTSFAINYWQSALGVNYSW